MKKAIIGITILLANVLAVSAQKNEVYVSYGIAPVWNEFMPEYIHYIPFASSNEYMGGVWAESRYKDLKTTGSINVMYLRHIIRGLSIGVSYSYYSTTAGYWIPQNAGLENPKTHTHVAMVTGKYKWLSFKRLSLYSRAGIGVVVNKGVFDRNEDKALDPENTRIVKENSTQFAWQVSGLGVEFKAIPHLSIFIEGGAGSQGCFLAGLKADF